MFHRGSRYEDVPTLEYDDGRGRVIRYKGIRAIPTPPGMARRTVDEGSRLDHLAFDHYRDPERFWRICDANLGVHPDDLTAEPGRVLDIPSAEA